MKIIHALRRSGGLEIMGSVAFAADHNKLGLEFRAGALEEFARGEFYPFLLLGPADLRTWPAMPADLLEHRPVTQLWARKRNGETSRKSLVWQGWPLLSSWRVAIQDYDDPMPEVHAALVRPMVALAKLLEHEHAAEGFGCGFKDGPRIGVTGLPPGDEDDYTSAELAAAHEPAPPALRGAYTQAMTEEFSAAQFHSPKGCGLCPPGCGLRCDGAMHCSDHCEVPAAEEDPSVPRDLAHENVSAGVAGKEKRARKPAPPQLGLFASDAGEQGRPTLPAPEPTQGPRADGTVDGTRVPRHVVEKYGPSPGSLRVRALGTCGLRFVTYGMEFDADRCPAMPFGVWIVAPAGTESAGCSFRVVRGEWEPVSGVWPDAPILTPPPAIR